MQEEKTCSYGEGLLVPVSREVGEGQAMRAAQPLLLLATSQDRGEDNELFDYDNYSQLKLSSTH